MVIRNAPRARVDVQVLVELTVLRKAAQLGVGIPTAQTPVASAGPSVEFQQLHLVAGVAQFIGGRHAGHACAQDQYRGARRCTLQLDRTAIRRLGCKTQAAHGLVHRGIAGSDADHAQQLTAAQ
jgi:hypothetical protein